MTNIRPAAVAGMFYPGEPGELDRTVRGLLAEAETEENGAPPPKAMIVPHAGYPYSGLVAARLYARLKPVAATVTRVVLIGPSHRVAFRGLALPTAEAYETPLGRVPLDTATMAKLMDLDGVGTLDQAHALEHSLEVQVPFLQEVLGDFTLVPVVAGDAAPETVAALLDAAWGGPETLIVISSDLSHFLDYDSCRALDERTAQAIEAFDVAGIGDDQACGRIGIRGLLTLAKARGLAVERVDVRNSGDTAGPRDRVVGYGAWAFTEPEAGTA